VDFAMSDVGGVTAAYSASVGTPRNWSGSSSTAAPEWEAPTAAENQVTRHDGRAVYALCG